MDKIPKKTTAVENIACKFSLISKFGILKVISFDNGVKLTGVRYPANINNVHTVSRLLFKSVKFIFKSKLTLVISPVDNINHIIP